MVIGVCGYGYTGSGAVIDLLREFDECSVNDEFEFCFTYIPYGLEDLRANMVTSPKRYNSSEAAIKDFRRWVKSQNTIRNTIQKGTKGSFVRLSEEYIRSLIDVTWKGYSSFDYVHYGWFRKKVLYRLFTRLHKAYNKTYQKEIDIFPNAEMSIAAPTDQEFIKRSKDYIRKLIKAADIDTEKLIVLNQPFEANAPEQSFEYFDDPKAIVVDKDPRDLYLLVKKVVLTQGKFIAADSVENFIKYYKATHKMIKSDKTDNVLRISFESLIYDYDSSVETIKKFLNIKNQNKKEHFFKPDQSVNNTQLFLKYKGYEDEIKMIEKELPEFLFPFEKYGEVCFSGKSF